MDWCDCHVHLDDDATLSELRRMHARIGVGRTVVVQRFTAGTDTRLLEAALAEDPTAVRGVTVIDDGVTDADLARLHAAGVRGVRVNLGQSHLPLRIGAREFERVCARVAPLGWHVKVLVEGPQLLEWAPVFRRVRVSAVIDHLGLLDPGGGLEQPAMRVLRELLAHANWWVLLAAADRCSHLGVPWSDMVPIVEVLAEAAPHRAIWGTDWPHSHHTLPLPEPEQLMALLIDALPDPQARHRILIDNPAKLYDFPR